MADAMNADEQAALMGQNKESEPAGISFKSFLEQIPPDTTVVLNDLERNTTGNYLKVPDLQLYCEACEGDRMFQATDSLSASSDWQPRFLKFLCRNCGTRIYRFSILLKALRDVPMGQAMKFAQIPAFGPQTPARLLRLVQPDRELLLQGRRSEVRGLGIGAFAYYRRVVENQRNRIIQNIAKAVKVVGSTPEIDQLFEDALGQYQFSKSIEMLKNVIPQALLINGENPLTLLHSALSNGLHDPEMTDQHCLELAQSIRIVLTELAERVAAVVKDDQELVKAINVLKRTPRSSKPALADAASRESEAETLANRDDLGQMCEAEPEESSERTRAPKPPTPVN